MSRVRTAVCTIVLVCLVAMMPIEARGQRVDPGGAPPAGSGPVDVSGPVRVIDGDTLEAFIHGRRVAIGLIGIRAPGGNTDCGEAATAALQQLTRGGLSLVEDASQTFDEAGRRMYLARTRDGRSIAEVLVSEGLARTEGPSPERERLATAEARAATSRTGCVWGGKLPTGDPRPGATSRSATPSRPSAAVAADPTISAAPSATLPAGFVEDVLVTGLSTPTSFAFLPDGRILIAEKNGVVRVFKDGALLPAPFLDMRSEVNNYWDRGLLAIAADPDFASNGHVYLYHSVEHDPANYAGPKVFRLTRVRASGDVAAPGSAVKILGTAAGGPCAVLPAGADCIPADVAWHNGGSIRFDGNGNLYLSTGDSGHHNFVDDRALRAQSLDSLAGKVLRVSRTGVGLPTNPFWNGDPNAVASKVWAYGVRNPFRFVLRPGSGLPYVADVGWVGWDEITTAPAGANLGWPCYEGAAQQSGFQSKSVCQALYGRGASAVAPPLHAYPAANGASVTGGDFYTGTAFPAEYQGSYFFGDYVYGWIRYLRLDDAHRLAAGPTDFATGTAPPIEILMGPDQSLYYITYGVTSGQLRRIRYGSPGTPPQPGVLLHSTLDSATAVSSPDRGTGVGASVTTAPTNDFVPAQTGNGLRIDAVGEQVRFQQVDGTTPNVDLDRGTIDVWYQPAYAHADGVRHPILGIGEWGSGSIHLVKGDATEGDALTVHVFDTAGTHRRTTVPSSAYGWQAGSWVRLRVTWDVHLAGAQDARIYVNGVEPTYAGVVNGPLSMPTESATRYIVLGAAGAPGGGAANGVFDEVTIYDRPIPAAPGPTTNQAPTVTIGSPTASSTYGVGESIAFDASASDPEDGPLPASALEWWLILHHCPGLCHIHQLIDFDGVASGSFAAPDPDYEYPSYLELQVTATDSVGLTSTASVTLQPKTVDLSFTSEPTGLRLTFGSESRVTPFRQQVLVGSRSSIGAVSPQQSGDASYDFYSWSDGGAQQHDIVAGVTPTTYTATFVRAGAPPPPAAPAPTSPGASVGGAVPTIDTLRPSFGWSEPAGATGYRVQLSTSAAFTSFVANATTTGPAYSLPSWQTLVRGTQYWWRVQATGASGTGPWSEAFTFRTPTIPGVPVLAAPGHGSTVASPTPTLDWHDVVGATGYQVQVATNSWFGTRIVDTTVTGDSEYTVPSALVPNTTYYWRVSARNGAGTSAWSGARTFKTPPP